MKGEIGHSQVGEPRVGLATTRRTTGAYPLFVQDFGDLGIDVIVEQLVDEFDHLRLGLHLLRGGFGILTVSVSVLPPLKRTWRVVVPSAGNLMNVTSSMT